MGRELGSDVGRVSSDCGTNGSGQENSVFSSDGSGRGDNGGGTTADSGRSDCRDSGRSDDGGGTTADAGGSHGFVVGSGEEASLPRVELKSVEEASLPRALGSPLPLGELRSLEDASKFTGICPST